MIDRCGAEARANERTNEGRDERTPQRWLCARSKVLLSYKCLCEVVSRGRIVIDIAEGSECEIGPQIEQRLKVSDAPKRIGVNSVGVLSESVFPVWRTIKN